MLYTAHHLSPLTQMEDLAARAVDHAVYCTSSQPNCAGACCGPCCILHIIPTQRCRGVLWTMLYTAHPPNHEVPGREQRVTHYARCKQTICILYTHLYSLYIVVLCASPFNSAIAWGSQLLACFRISVRDSYCSHNKNSSTLARIERKRSTVTLYCTQYVRCCTYSIPAVYVYRCASQRDVTSGEKGCLKINIPCRSQHVLLGLFAGVRRRKF